MTLVEVVLALAKTLVMLLFLLNMAAIATWADRRQSAMVQDRVGPNRATVFLPSFVVRAILFLPPAALAALAALGASQKLAPVVATEGMLIGFELATFVVWFGLALLTRLVRSGGAKNGFESVLANVLPRNIFFTGIAFHVAFVIISLTAGSQAVLGAQIGNGLLAIALAITALYSAARVPAGPIPIRLAGTLHAFADAIKLVWKEDFIPPNADKLLHSLAPILAMFPAMITCAVIPFGRSLCFKDNGNGTFDFADLANVARIMPNQFRCDGYTVNLQIADLNVGILYLFAVAGTGVIGAAIAGWASDNKFSLLGGLRAASQMLSYEVTMGLSLVGLFMIYSSVRLGDMVEWQGNNAWGIFVQPFAFFLFLTALAAETKRVPFDQPEGESEIVSGYFVEYSGMKFGMFFTGEYIELIASSALLATLFFGGYQLPFLRRDGFFLTIGTETLFDYRMTHASVVAISAIVFFAKTIFITWVQIFFRWTLPRFRYDQVMKLGWTKLLPLSLGNIFVTGTLLLLIMSTGPGVQAYLKVAADLTQLALVVAMVGGFVALLVLAAKPVTRRQLFNSTTTRFARARSAPLLTDEGATS